MNSKINITYRDKNDQIIECPEEGQLSYSPETHQLYKFTNGSWELMASKGGLKVTQYELNKQLIAHLADFTKEDIEKAKDLIYQFGHHNLDNYFMLLCNDIHYYTIFHLLYPDIDDVDHFTTEVIACLQNIGAIKSIEKVESQEAIEIWVQPANEDPIVMYLFPYDKGVIECIL